MVNSNKILTVSYGTFSCTLEGFEDSFGTMKAIAEYFRDLAADDRYFGAEPPQPDADMLARIAEKEITRQVRARQDSNRIVLRADDLKPAETAPAQPVAEKQAARPTAPVGEPPMADSIAAKLQRIRAVVSQADAAPGGGFVEDPDAEAPLSPRGLRDDIIEISAAMDVDDAAMEAEETADDIAASAEISAALAMLEAASEDGPEDEVYDEELASPVSVTAVARASEEFVLEDDPAEVPVDEAEETPFPTEVQETAESDVLRLSRFLADEGEEDPEASAPAALFDDKETDGHQEDAADDEIVNIMDDGEDSGAPRLLKIRRSELDAAIAAGDLEEVDDDEEEAPSRTTALSPEQEAELERELAGVLTETDEDEDEEDDDRSVDRFTRGFSEAGTGGDITRLMADAQKRMDTPESSSSREAYSHLRAAVAVAKAEKSVGRTLDTQTTDDAYRDDLANVVRPRRPGTAAGQRPDWPADGSRPAPLKLVAEQRVDLESTQRAPVQPRRLSHEIDLEEEDDDKGFVEFAREQGVTELPQLLEAAAAYLSFVEGQEQFSRPQLMRKVRQLENQDFNREDGLRTFGQLLRDGKIEKTGGGRFTAAHDIGYRPDRRAAG
ncbi:hypothetical protein ACFO5X_15380 [Seohaeicola nanhaiensis]|uniref:Chemotaxis protein CheA n=1 Tax=Seohaeicola nanhaiensis TaxID=1387282 RepID=A0ABV9KIF0_9RHOB